MTALPASEEEIQAGYRDLVQRVVLAGVLWVGLLVAGVGFGTVPLVVVPIGAVAVLLAVVMIVRGVSERRDDLLADFRSQHR